VTNHRLSPKGTLWACGQAANPSFCGDRAYTPLTQANDSDVIWCVGHVVQRSYWENAMSKMLSRALVLTMLQHAEEFPWRMQDIGLMALRLDDQREYRLHVWDPSSMVGEPPIHDHPYDFTSTIIAGELTNTRYQEDPEGDEYVRFRYSPGAEGERRSDAARLASRATTITEGNQYRQLAHELHASWQQPGTVTAIRCLWVEASELTVCVRDESSWYSGQGRVATSEEVKSFTAKALEWF
jgi:hypothetical protein